MLSFGHGTANANMISTAAIAVQNGHAQDWACQQPIMDLGVTYPVLTCYTDSVGGADIVFSAHQVPKEVEIKKGLGVSERTGMTVIRMHYIHV